VSSFCDVAGFIERKQLHMYDCMHQVLFVEHQAIMWMTNLTFQFYGLHYAYVL
jgi:hypothetical protein